MNPYNDHEPMTFRKFLTGMKWLVQDLWDDWRNRKDRYKLR